MKSILPRALALAAIVAAGHASAAITLFGHDGFHGKRVTLDAARARLPRLQLQRPRLVGDRRGRALGGLPGHRLPQPLRDPRAGQLPQPGRGRPGRPAVVRAPGAPRTAAAAAAAAGRAAAATGDIVFFEHPGFHGRDLGTSSEIDNLTRYGFNDRASSVIVFEGRWEVCEHADFNGRCMILRPGRYPDLRAMGLNDRISSVRRVHREARVDDDRYAPPPQPVYDWRRRPQEFVEAVPIESVHVVYAAPQQQQCWVEQIGRARERAHRRRAGGRPDRRHPGPPDRRRRQPRRRDRRRRRRRRGRSARRSPAAPSSRRPSRAAPACRQPGRPITTTCPTGTTACATTCRRRSPRARRSSSTATANRGSDPALPGQVALTSSVRESVDSPMRVRPFSLTRPCFCCTTCHASCARWRSLARAQVDVRDLRIGVRLERPASQRVAVHAHLVQAHPRQFLDAGVEARRQPVSEFRHRASTGHVDASL